MVGYKSIYVTFLVLKATAAKVDHFNPTLGWVSQENILS